MLKKLIAWTLLGAVVAGAAGVGALAISVRRAPSRDRGKVVRFEVPRGQPFVTIAERLHDQGLIGNVFMWRTWAWLLRVERESKSGMYEFRVGERPDRILQRLVDGDILKVRVTIPEGYMRWEIAGAMEAAGVDSLAMLAATNEPDVFHIDAPTLEGYLFPDTYQVPWAIEPGGVIEIMLERLDAVFDDELERRRLARGMSRHEVITLASIIEAETRVGSERELVSAVYHSRLERGMRLEADPTVAYAMGGYRGRLLYADLEIESPYNTYRNYGLPPGPICSPGEASIRAAVNPDTTSDALYFVARGDGSHIFSKTLREHQAAVRKVRERRRNQSSE